MDTPITLVLGKHNIAHLDTIKSALPDWIINSSPKQLEQLRGIKPELPEWFKQAPAAQHRELRDAQTDSWTKRNDVENELKHLLDVHAFAEPLLKKHIKQRFQLDLDVKETFIHLYIPATLPVLGLPGDGAKTWTVSLLDAALHNFEAFEAAPDAHLPESGFITRPDTSGRYKILDKITARLPVATFIKFCRDLDIGARYDAHLREGLGLDDRAKQLRLKTRIIDSHIADLKAVLHHAALTNDIKESSLRSILSFIAGREKTWQAYDLSLLSTALIGPMVFSPDNDGSATQPVVAYIPHDPTYPLKEHPSMSAFIAHLTERLRDDHYKQFFSRFIQHDQLAGFHWTLKRKFFHVIEDRPNAPDFALPEYGFVEEVRPIPSPSLDYTTSKIAGDIWEQRYSQQLRKIFNDAKVIAVSTDSEDRKTRHDRWERIKSIGLALFNAAVFVIAPFVPVVGELMLAQMAYQLLEDAYEGVRDWVEGKSIEAFEHLFAIVESVLEAAGFAVGGQIIGDLLPKPSAFVENLKPVTSRDGKTRLWNPDITPYAHPTEVPRTSKPNELGLHEHNEKTLLQLKVNDDMQHTLMLKKAEQAEHYTLVHPTRAEAYAPRMEHNGRGAWSMEGEQPQSWEGTTLMRRLGHATDGFSDAELQKLRIISGTEEGALRRVHLYKQAMPPLLDDSLVRFKTHKALEQNIRKIRAGEAIDTQGNWPGSLLTQLDGWPADRALEVFADPTLTGIAHYYGRPVPDGDVIKISSADVKDGKLSSVVVQALDEEHLSGLLGPDTPKGQATEKLNEKLADEADSRKEDIFNYEYGHQAPMRDADVSLIEATFPELPDPVTRALLDTASTAEKATISNNGRIALRLKNLARELQVQTKISRAQEGLLEDDLLSPEGEKLTLNTVKIYSDAISDVHIEVHDKMFDGRLRSQHQPPDARIKRVLVRKGLGAYEVRDGDGRLLRPATTFHSALLKALPRENLDKLTSGFKPGESFKQWLADKYRIHGEVRTALEFPKAGTAVTRETEVLLRGPAYSRLSQAYNRWLPAAEAPQQENPLINRVKQLYPHRDELEISDMVSRIDSDDMLGKLGELESERNQLFGELDDWVKTPYLDLEKRTIAYLIKDSWLRADKEHINPTGVKNPGATLDLSGGILGELSPERIRFSKPLDHVTELVIDDCRFSDSSAAFLDNFPELEVLSAQDNKFTRLPPAVRDMRKLMKLDLSRNKIEIASSETPLNLPRVRYLDLSSNPLGSPPDVSLMPRLRTLLLNRAHITEWPRGLFSSRRTDSFDLRLLGNQITTVPTHEPGSEESWLLVRTRIDRENLGRVNRELLDSYWQAFGLDPYRTYARRFWLDDMREHLNEETFNDMKTRWSGLKVQDGSEGFFQVIEQLAVRDIDLDLFQTTEDRIKYELSRASVTDKVWRVIDAAHDDPVVCSKLFTMAAAPANCADAGAQIFNAMGIETLLYEYYEAGSDAQTLGKNLIRLARGKARLNKIHQIAREDVAQRVRPIEEGGQGLRFSSDVVEGTPGTVDEVEVHTAYQTALVDRLDLPWVQDYMVYRNTADVPDDVIQRAEQLVLEAEEHDGLVNQILDLDVDVGVDFWEKYLKETHGQEFAQNDAVYTTQADQLVTMQSLQKEWVESAIRIEDRNSELERELSELARMLQVPEEAVLTQEVMPEGTVARIYSEINDRKRELAFELTRLSLSRAGLDNNPLPPF